MCLRSPRLGTPWILAIRFWSWTTKRHWENRKSRRKKYIYSKLLLNAGGKERGRYKTETKIVLWLRVLCLLVGRSGLHYVDRTRFVESISIVAHAATTASSLLQLLCESSVPGRLGCLYRSTFISLFPSSDTYDNGTAHGYFTDVYSNPGCAALQNHCRGK